MRGDNWNERLGKVKADDLALIASDVNGGGTGNDLKPVTLKTVLSNISKYGKYADLSVDSVLDEELDQEISVRFQTAFLPVDEGENRLLNLHQKLITTTRSVMAIQGTWCCSVPRKEWLCNKTEKEQKSSITT